MDDVTPKLLDAIQNDFGDLLSKNRTLACIAEKAKYGKVTYKEAHTYAAELGRILSQAYSNHLSSETLPDGKMYFNIAQRILQPTLGNNYELASEIAMQAQKAVNKKAKIGLAVKKPDLNQDKIDGIINRISSEDNFDDASWILDEPVVTFSQSVVDEVLKTNADLHAVYGLHPRIIRTTVGKCCKWCQSITGVYDYPGGAPRDIFRRHNRCRCTTEYSPNGTKRQDVWLKKWRTVPKSALRLNNNISVGHSSGAMFKNAYSVKLPDGRYARLAGGTKITKIKVFAGKGTDVPIREANMLEKAYHYKAKEWEKARGEGIIRDEGENKKAELHWYQAGKGKKKEIVKMKVKRFMNDS